MKTELFNDLFVLELANNHWGDLRRGLRIIRTYAEHVKNTLRVCDHINGFFYFHPT